MTSTEFESHPIFEKLQQLQSRLDEQSFRQLVDLEGLNFFDSATQYIDSRLKLTLPVLVQNSELSTLSQEIENSLVQINTFAGNNNNTGYIDNAVNNLNIALGRVKNLPLPISKNDFDFSKEIASFERTLKEKYGALGTTYENSKTKIKELEDGIEAKNLELKRITELLSQKETEIQQMNITFQTEFSSIKATATQNYETDRVAFRTEFNSTVTDFVKQNEDVKKTNEESGKKVIDTLNVKLDEAKKIVGVIGNVSVTGNYQQVANSDKTNANHLRLVAIILMIIMSGLLICTIWDISAATYDWEKALVRILAVIVLSYPATYAARESSKHRKLEIINRRAELELASINPFIELLPDSKKEEIKEKLVDKYFGNNAGQTTETDDKKDDEVSINALDKILKTVLSNIKFPK